MVGVGSAIMPTLNTSLARPCFSYHAARIYSDSYLLQGGTTLLLRA